MDTGRDVTLQPSVWLVSSVLHQITSSSSTNSEIHGIKIRLSVGSRCDNSNYVSPVALMRGVVILGVIMNAKNCSQFLNTAFLTINFQIQIVDVLKQLY